jgi:hypothetical protein
MNPSDREKLLKEILSSEDVSDFRQNSLARGLAGLRRERRRRQLVRFSSAAAVLICLVVGILLKSANPVRNEHASVQRSAQPAPASLADSHVDFISDDQLLAFFTNQPVALVGKPGDQHLVFLGESENDSARKQF